MYYYSCVEYLFILTSIFISVSSNKLKSISIRGHPKPQQLPFQSTIDWNIYTYENKCLTLVENDLTEGWVNPTSYDTLYLPSDLPLPKICPALGIVVANGVPRYIMPSIITYLQTAANLWRNRGVNSLPRSHAWIDLFAVFTPKLSQLRYSLYEKNNPDVRFLEDQDGITAWQSLLSDSLNSNTLFIPKLNEEEYSIGIEDIYNNFKDDLLTNPKLDVLKSDGYHFIDIPLISIEKSLNFQNGIKLKAYLTDFTEPKRLLEFEAVESLELEPCGELDLSLMRVAAGRSSKYLPEVSYSLVDISS